MRFNLTVMWIGIISSWIFCFVGWEIGVNMNISEFIVIGTYGIFEGIAFAIIGGVTIKKWNDVF